MKKIQYKPNPGCLRVLFFVLLSSIFPVKIFCQAVATLENDELLMGKTMSLSIAVPVPNDSVNVEFPLLEKAAFNKQKYAALLNDSIEILTRYSKTIEKEDNKDWIKYKLTVQAFDSGRYQLPPFEFIVGGEKINSNSLNLNVIPVKAKADDKIEPFSDIVEPFEVNPNPEEMESPHGFLWWLIPVALIFLGIIAYLYLRYKKTGKILLLSKPLSPHETALNKLKKLQSQNLPQKGRTKEYYTKLTDILRSYINRQFHIKTFEKTSNEILRQIEENDQLCRFEGVLKSIFETSDFVKFAKVQPSVVENSRCLADAERFVEASFQSMEENKNTDAKKGGNK